MSRIRADKLVNRAGTGAPELPFGLNAPGGLNVTGIVTATSFQGDGSALTGVGDPSALKDGSNTKVQATATGANVTGNVAATGNVTAVDGTFSGNAIVQGNLTVNGTTTTIDTAVTAVDSLAVDGNITAGGDVSIADKIVHTSDTDTAIRFPAADTFAVETAGSERFRVDSSGRLLVGVTTTPFANDVNFQITDNTNAKFLLRNPSYGTFSLAVTNDSVLALKDEANAEERLRITSAGHILPGADNTQDLGSSAKRFANIYTGDLNLSNEGSVNDVDGTWGNYTIQEGEDNLFLINKRTGKKYKFNLTEVD
jgi:hypothetical protein